MPFSGLKILAQLKATLPMDRNILQGTCQANTDKSPTFVPRLYRSNVPKNDGDICYHFQVPELLASLGMTETHKRFRDRLQGARLPTSLGMPRNRNCFQDRFSLHYLGLWCCNPLGCPPPPLPCPQKTKKRLGYIQYVQGSATPQREAALATKVTCGQSYVPNRGTDPRSAWFPRAPT